MTEMVLCTCGHTQKRHARRGSEYWCYKPQMPNPKCSCLMFTPAVRITGHMYPGSGYYGNKYDEHPMLVSLGVNSTKDNIVEWLCECSICGDDIVETPAVIGRGGESRIICARCAGGGS